MARKTTSTSLPIENLGTEVSMNNLHTVANAYQAWIQGLGACNAEVTRFIGQRLSKDFDVPAELTGCQTPTDVLEVQSSFIQTMISDYAEEAQRLSALATESFANGMEGKSGD